MNKQAIVTSLAFVGFFIWHVYEINILHKNIRKVRKEAWFDSHENSDREIINMRYLLIHLADRVDSYHGAHPDYPQGYPICEEEKEIKRDPLTEYLIDQSL